MESDQPRLTPVPVDVVLHGPPGAGKGTQAPRLAGALGAAHVCTGDLLRAAFRMDPDGNRLAMNLIARGQPTPDEEVEKLLAARLRDDPGTRRGVIWDGYPRNLAQARNLDRMLAGHGRAVSCVLVLDVPLSVLLGRLAARRICGNCGRLYQIGWNVSAGTTRCDCSAALIRRTDDHVEAIHKRHATFLLDAEPLLEYFSHKGLKVSRVDGGRAVESVTADLLEAVGCATGRVHDGRHHGS